MNRTNQIESLYSPSHFFPSERDVHVNPVRDDENLYFDRKHFKGITNVIASVGVFWVLLSCSGHKPFQNIADLILEAKEERKVLALYFYADWCAPCHQFKKNLEENSDLKQFVDDRLLLKEIDSDSEFGKKLFE